MSFDIATAMLVTSLLTLGVGGTLLFAASGYPAHLQWVLRVWIGGLVLQALALLAVALLGPVPSVPVLVASDTLYALAFAEMGRAMDRFTGRPDRHFTLLALVAAVGLASWLFSAVWPLPRWRIAVECVPLAVLQLAVAQSILYQREELRPADRLTGLLFLVCGLLALSRSATALVQPLLGVPRLGMHVRHVFLVFASLLPSLGTIGFVMMCSDRFNEGFRRLAMLDPLTGAYNRRTLAGQADAAIAVALKENRPMALLAIDVDHFKHINDTFGHDAGDDALRGLVARLREVLRADHSISRIGGEEFAVLLAGCDEAGAAVVAERLRTHVAASPLSLNGHPVTLHLSLGVAALEGDVRDLRTLLRNADRALYVAKRTGRNRVVTSSTLGAVGMPA